MDPSLPSPVGQTGAPRIDPPPPTGSTVEIDVDAVAEDILRHRPSIDIGSCLGRSWRLLTRNFWMSVGVCVVGMLVGQVPVIMLIMQAGLYWYFLRLIRGEDARFEDAFAGFSKAFLPALVAAILLTLGITVGFAACIVPGLILTAMWSFTLPLLVDRRIDFWPAMELSRKVAWPNIWGILGLWLVSGLLMLAGVLCLYIGIFIAFPWVVCAQAYAYEDFFGRKTLDQQPS